MRRVGIKALKNNLSRYVHAAAGGERVLVTDRDKVVAELVPPQQCGASSEDDVVARGAREGWLTPPKRHGPLPDRGPRPPDQPTITFERLMEDLARDREDR
ncbi:type II toxin-antitoxin system Phd/YefM family antitoxin [Enterovirga rhinocerotis]|uniref:Antitoxin n=1 Tax=Enterovirga rhinocerotis TaxID=1339210 RepID=A0A4R7BY10_9HYPH|nr:type II toxin-antitoxin system Phd/YefM family antitoxin [Enterovirga rhinocerotis]TDR90491.1 antitoxin (DNA-binding transcriptional repressor) of toxin-antitoxin stability system [Enterovirga rhinocerotis]